MCPVVFLAMIFSFLLLLLEVTAAFNVTFSPKNVTYDFYVDAKTEVRFSFEENTKEYNNDTVYDVECDNPSVAQIYNVTFDTELLENPARMFFNGSFILQGKFIGFTAARVIKKTNETKISSSEDLEIAVRREHLLIQKIFVYSVVTLVTLNYINMGCALDLNVVKSVLRKPIAPCIGFFSQYTIMPLVAYGLATVLYQNDLSREHQFYQYGLFAFGCSPGGGASNTWTVLLKGNLDLSLTMTFISVIAALGMIPLWLFTLGKKLFVQSKTGFPYDQLLYTLASMIVFLGVGLLFQRYRPHVAKFCRRILVPASIGLIIFIVIFGTYANYYMFRLFTWKVMLASCCSVWLGFLFGAVVSKLARLPYEDIIAVSIETGVQNAGITIALLNIAFSVASVEADIGSVFPVAGSIVTPFPLITLYCVQKAREYFAKKTAKKNEYVLTDECDEVQALPSANSTESYITSKKVSNGFES